MAVINPTQVLINGTIIGGTIDNTVIGGTTAAAGTFTTLTATGQTSLGGAAGSESFRVVTRASATDYVEADGGTSGTSGVYLSAQGASANINLFLSAKTGAVRFYTGGKGSLEQFRVSNTASAVNYLQVTGAVTGGNPSIVSAGSDGAIGLSLSSKSTSSIFFYTNNLSANSRHLDITHTGTVVNRFQLTGAQTGFGVTLGVNGSDANISQVFQSKGTGAIDLVAGSSGVNISNGGTVTAITGGAGGSYTTIPTITIAPPTTAGGVQATGTCAMGILATSTIASAGSGYAIGDTITLSGGTFSQAAVLTVATLSGSGVATFTVTTSGFYTVLPSSPISTTSSGVGTGFTLTGAWAVRTTNFTITNAGSGYVEQPTITFSSGAATAYATVGSGTVVKSIGSTMSFYTPGGEGFRVVDSGVTSAAYWAAYGASGTPDLRASGPGTISSTGANQLSLRTNTSVEQVRVAHTASAVNYVQVTGAITGAAPVMSAQGSDAAVGLTFNTKSTGVYTFQTNGTTRLLVNSGGTVQLGYANAVPCFTAAGVASQVNGFQVSGSIAGSAPSLSSTGTDADIDITLTPKGAGAVRFGTYTGTILTSTGYITIKDSGGTTRRLLVG